MPAVSIWMIRSSLGYLSLGFSIGALLLFHKGIPILPPIWALLPSHVEFLLMGWIVQFVMGTAFWILPRSGRGPRRGKVGRVWFAYGMLNTGIWITALSSFPPAPEWLALAGRAGEVIGVAAFLSNAWPRVKPSAAGEKT